MNQHSHPIMAKKFIQDFVEPFLARKNYFLDLISKHASPLFVVEKSVLHEKARYFKQVFEGLFDKTSFYFAMKSNNHPKISAECLKIGFGLDVSSGQELEVALDLGASDIIFSGPGKTRQELQLAIAHSRKVTLLIDSLGEYQRLAVLLEKRGCFLNVGIRFNPFPQGLWRKFGVFGEEFVSLYEAISKNPSMTFKGIQFHTSWNLNPDKQVEAIVQLGSILAHMPPSFRNSCEFLDIGGGYWPPQGEWLVSKDPLVHYHLPAEPLEAFAEKLQKAITQSVLPWLNCRICFEPGRWICNDALHLFVQVVDKKAHDLVIADCGTNAVGWERFETDYFPVINLTHGSLEERPCQILGSLCTPHDVWGYAFFGTEINEGDILMIPTQGAYTYSLRQNFIKPVPSVVFI